MTRTFARLRVWLHRLLYRAEWIPFDDHIVHVCDCGGHARIYRNADGSATVTDDSCPMWTWIGRTMQMPLPKARLLQ